jgi:hypothetical protein
MASSVSISRLHAAANVSPAPVKCSNFEHSQADVSAEPTMHELFARSLAMPLRRRFGRMGPETRFSAPALRSAVAPTSVPGDRADFASLAQRDHATAVMRAAVSRWQAQQAGHQQHADVRIQI